MTSTVPVWLATASTIVTFLAALVVAVAGAIGLAVGVYKFCTGGFKFMKTLTKINKFVDRVDVLVDDFWPEVLGSLERQGFVTVGATARWTSVQAKILKSASPIQITDVGEGIIGSINFSEAYDLNTNKILGLVREKLRGKKNVTEFDIEQASLQASGILFSTSDPTITNAKSYAFNHPQMPLSQLEALVGIFIRDKILKDPSRRTEFGLTNPKS